MGERWDLELTDVKDRVSDGRRRPQLNGVGRDVTGQSAAHEVSKSRDLRSVESWTSALKSALRTIDVCRSRESESTRGENESTRGESESTREKRERTRGENERTRTRGESGERTRGENERERTRGESRVEMVGSIQ